MPKYLTPFDTEKVASTRFLDDMDVEVSTIACYHQAGVTYDDPLYYETMVFAKGYPEIDECDKPELPYHHSYTRDEALDQHARVVERVGKFLQAYPRQTVVQ